MMWSGRMCERLHRRTVLAAVPVFFFSSRRRHTRCSRDWSSDVCSSDLSTEKVAVGFSTMLTPELPVNEILSTTMFPIVKLFPPDPPARDRQLVFVPQEIGRASCRERV